MISLIIPMYNSERTIAKTLNSALEQTVPFQEIIVVDNGSSDQSVAIVSNTCKEYAHVRLLTCEQKGVSSARNMGIEASQSPYIGFLDADDILEQSYVEILTKSITEHPNVEMHHFNFYQQFKSGIIKQNKYFLHDKEMYSGLEFMQETLKRFSFEAKHMVWTFIFKKEFLNQYHLRFNTEMTIFEDILFLHEVFGKNPEIIIIDSVLVYYLFYNESLTNDKSSEYFSTILFLKNELPEQKKYLMQLSSRCLTSTEFKKIWNNALVYYYFKIAYTKNRVFQKLKKGISKFVSI